MPPIELGTALSRLFYSVPQPKDAQLRDVELQPLNSSKCKAIDADGHGGGAGYGNDSDSFLPSNVVMLSNLNKQQRDKILAQANKPVAHDKPVTHSKPVAAPASIGINLAKVPYLTKELLSKLLTKISVVLKFEFKGRAVDAEVTELLESINKLNQQTISHDEWAAASKKLQRLLDLLEKEDAKKQDGVSRLDYPKFVLKLLARVCTDSWRKLAVAKLTQQFVEEMENETADSPLLYKNEITTVSVDVSPGFLPSALSIGADVTHERATYSDSEGNLYVTKSVGGGVSLKANAIAASGAARGGGSVGIFEYGKTARDHVTYFFDELVEEHKCRPNVAPLLSRSATLGLPPMGEEGMEILQLEQLSDSYLEHCSQHFSVMLSLDYSNLCEKPPENADGAGLAVSSEAARSSKTVVQLVAPAPNRIRLTAGTITNKTGTVSGTAGFKSGMLQVNAGVTLQGTKQSKTTDTTRRMTFCEFLEHRYVKFDVKEDFRQKLTQKGLGLYQKLQQFWYPKADHNKLDKFGLLQSNINKFIVDFKAYSELHSPQAQGRQGNQKSIDIFNKKYFAESTDECLENMATLTAYFFDQLNNQLKPEIASVDEIKQLKAALVTLETTIHSNAIPHSANYLENHACVSQNINYTNNETAGQLTVGAGSLILGAHSSAEISKGGSDDYYNIYRSGGYWTVEFTMGTNKILNERTLNRIMEFVKGEKDFSKLEVAAFKAYFIPPNFIEQKTYSIQFYKPKEFPGLPYRKHHERITAQETELRAFEIPIIVPGVVSVDVGFSHSKSIRSVEGEIPSSDTIFYIAQRYQHGLSSGKIDVKTGEVRQKSYYDSLERDHPDVFKKLFTNYAEGILQSEEDEIEINHPDAFKQMSINYAPGDVKLAEDKSELDQRISGSYIYTGVNNLLASAKEFIAGGNYWYGWIGVLYRNCQQLFTKHLQETQSGVEIGLVNELKAMEAAFVSAVDEARKAALEADTQNSKENNTVARRKALALEKEADQLQAELEGFQTAKIIFLGNTQDFYQNQTDKNYQKTLTSFKDMLRAYYPFTLLKREYSESYKEFEYFPTLMKVFGANIQKAFLWVAKRI